MAVNSELGQKKIAEMREKRDEGYVDVSKKIAELSEKALAVYEEIFDSDTVSYNLKKSTSDTVLMDLGGHRAPTKIDSRSVSVNTSMEELEEFKQAGLRAAKESGFLIELPEGETIDVN
jgi:ABC-type Fe3+-hydroxamate transport system substrate-binding protein